jgi:curli biogenesis system outer membrane secretion channel CsgG
MMKYTYLILPLVLIVACGSSSKKNQPTPRKERLLVIVSDVINATGDKQYQSISDKTASCFVAELAKTEQFRIIERQRLDDILKEKKLSMTGLVNSDNVKEIGKILGANSIIIVELTNVKYDTKHKGVFSKTLSETIEVNVSARVVLVETGEIIASESSTAKQKTDGKPITDDSKAIFDGKLELVRKTIDDTAPAIAKSLGKQISKYYKSQN